MPYPSSDPTPDFVIVTSRNTLRAIIAEEMDRSVRRTIASLVDDLGRDEDWLPPKKAVEFYGHSRSTLHRWATAGLLPKRKIAGSVYYSRGAIERLSGQADV